MKITANIELHDVPYPVTILNDRYMGSYSGAAWTAWNKYPDDIPAGPEASDIECRDFWREYRRPVGKGSTPDAALADLARQLSGEPKRFRGVWGRGYEPGTLCLGIESFHTGRGYDEEDIDAIHALGVGETWTAPTPEEHTVTRIA